MFKFFAYSNLFISLCVAAFTFQTYIICDVKAPFYWQLIVINAICTFFIYNAQRLYFASKNENSNKYEWYNKNRKWIFTIAILLLGSFLLDVFNFFNSNKIYILYYIVLGIISVFYFLKPINIRGIGVLKSVVISLVFIVCGILIPVNFKLDTKTSYYLLAQFFLIVTLCLLFDIRDNAIDKENKLNTLPNIIGITKTKYVAVLLVVLYGIFEFMFCNYTLKLNFVLILVITSIAIVFSSEKRTNFYYLYLVDGVILIQSIIFVIFNNH